jgi:hypothetical protein
VCVCVCVCDMCLNALFTLELLLLLFSLKTGSLNVAQIDLKLEILLPQPSECWNYATLFVPPSFLPLIALFHCMDVHDLFNQLSSESSIICALHSEQHCLLLFTHASPSVGQNPPRNRITNSS